MTERAVAAAYDARSTEYAALLGSVDRLDATDLDLVRRWCRATSGLVLDAGCGPGQWTEVLAEGGRDVVGLDLSARFLDLARQRRPQRPFLRASLGALPLRSGTVGAVLAWFSTIHTPPDALAAVLAELARVLRPDGSLLLGYFAGRAGQGFAHAVAPAYYSSPDALAPLLAGVGLEVVEHRQRPGQGHGSFAALTARPAGAGGVRLSPG